jgi:hypothetical protein
VEPRAAATSDAIVGAASGGTDVVTRVELARDAGRGQATTSCR